MNPSKLPQLVVSKFMVKAQSCEKTHKITKKKCPFTHNEIKIDLFYTKSICKINVRKKILLTLSVVYTNLTKLYFWIKKRKMPEIDPQL